MMSSKQSNDEKQFEAFYHDVLKPEIDILDGWHRDFQEKTTKKKSRYLYVTILGFMLAVFSVAFIWSTNPEVAFGIGFTSFTLASVFWYLLKLINQDYDKLIKKIRYYYKKNIIGKFLLEYFENFAYLPHQHVGRQKIAASHLYTGGTYIKGGEDFFRFHFGDVMIQFSEIRVAYHRDVEGLTQFFLSVEFNKPFKSQTIVVPETKFKLKKGIDSNSLLFGYRDATRHMELVNLEFSDFENEFVVYSESQIEARYILSPSLMQKLVDFKMEKQWKPYMSFYDNRLYMRFDAGHNFFEAQYDEGTFGKYDNVKEDLKIIQDIVDIIEALNLDQKVWKV